ncbi:MAG TPA: redox-sensing transcriptional repressor Rex, partial [Erysipelotrichaceae bacterium]|nr:redox-sensing transcriptional repressor Rex [Erysipelotrichaceae bacterium]
NRWDYVVGEIVMAFDIKPELVGRAIKRIPVYHIDELEERIPDDCRIAIVATSGDVQDLIERLYKCGVIGIIDFTHTHIQVPKGMTVKSVDVVTKIQELVFETNIIKKFR